MFSNLFYNSTVLLFLSLQKEDLAKNLGPLLEPDPVVFSLDTIGWKISVLLLTIISVSLSVYRLIEYKKNKYRRKAIGDLMGKVSVLENENLIVYANSILKRMAIEVYGRKQVANLYGRSWTQYLDSKTKEVAFDKYYMTIQNATHNLEVVNNIDCNHIITLTKKWIQTHAR